METIGCQIVELRRLLQKIKVLLMKRQKGGNHVRSEINKSNRIHPSSGDTGFSCYAKENKNNTELIENLIERARDCKGLSHREAALLLECEDPRLDPTKCIMWQRRLNRNFMETES